VSGSGAPADGSAPASPVPVAAGEAAARVSRGPVAAGGWAAGSSGRPVTAGGWAAGSSGRPVTAGGWAAGSSERPVTAGEWAAGSSEHPVTAGEWAARVSGDPGAAGESASHPSTHPTPGGDERARLFVALDLPEPGREALVRWRESAVSGASGLRPVRPEDLHATLCFLGSRPVREIDEIAAACCVVAGEPPIDSAFGESVWLPRRRPRVLAVELHDEQGALARIQATLSSALAAGGWYAPESRPFLAHVTVMRVAKDARIRTVRLPALPAIAVRCSRVTLYRSRLSPSGARYEPITVVELGSAPGAADPVSVVRRFHAEQARMYAGEDSARVRDLLSEDVVWHVPGASAIAGEHRGVEAVLAYMDARRRMMDNTFRVTVHGAALIAGRVVQLAGGRALRDGHEVTWETVGVFRVAGGLIAECWLIPFDQQAFDRIWS
jgi:RNA 2',3'-cyclic 3'-phosphodiesterase